MAIIISILLAFVGVYLFSFYNSFRLWRKFVKYGKKIPGPPMDPLLGNAPIFNGKSTDEIFELFVNLANEYRAKGQNVLRIQMFGVMYVWPLNGKTLAKILDSTTELQKGDDYKFSEPWLGGGLILEDGGNRWRTHRKMLTPTFHFAKLAGYFEVFNNESKILIDCLEKHALTGETVDLFPYFKRCTLDTICETAMGTKLNAQLNYDQKYVKAVEGFNKLSIIYATNPLLWNKIIFKILGYQKMYDDDLQTLKEFTTGVLKERREAYAAGEVEKATSKRTMNFLDLLLNMEESNELSEEDIRQEVDTFMFAGHDTTTVSTSWLCWNLAHQPEVQEKVYQEMIEVFGEDLNSEVTLEGINKLHYTDRVIKESKRIIPPVPSVQRKLWKDLELDGHVVPSEATISIGPVMLHNNPDAFQNPEKFDPDRFLPEEIAKRHAYDYVPFSAGLRNCIGQKFSQLNEKVLISNLLRNYKIEPKLGFHETRPCYEVITKPSRGIPVKLIKRMEQ